MMIWVLVLVDPRHPSWSSSKESICNMGDVGLTPGLGGSPGEGNGNPLQDSCLGNPINRAPTGQTSSNLGKFIDDIESQVLFFSLTSRRTTISFLNEILFLLICQKIFTLPNNLESEGTTEGIQYGKCTLSAFSHANCTVLASAYWNIIWRRR